MLLDYWNLLRPGVPLSYYVASISPYVIQGAMNALQTLKDYVIAHRMETWARPLWQRLAGKRTDVDRYDEQTFMLIRRFLQPDSACLDIGCHKGAILDAMTKQCPHGTFYAFEPVPSLAKMLRSKYRYQAQVIVHEMALSSQAGTAEFFIDVEFPGRSGLRNTSDERGIHKTQVHTVQQATIDSIISNVRVDFVKIDVEGAELAVLRGGATMFHKYTPLTVFEHAKFGARHYDTQPQDVFLFFTDCGMQLSLISRLLVGEGPLSEHEFVTEHINDTNYFFVAYNPIALEEKRVVK